jgi:hypothetical protein
MTTCKFLSKSVSPLNSLVSNSDCRASWRLREVHVTFHPLNGFPQQYGLKLTYLTILKHTNCRYRWPRGLRPLVCRGFESLRGHGCWSLLLILFCVGSGLCDGLTTRSEECVCIIVCNLGTSTVMWHGPSWAAGPQKKANRVGLRVIHLQQQLKAQIRKQTS